MHDSAQVAGAFSAERRCTMRRTLHQGVSNAWSAPDVNLARHVLALLAGGRGGLETIKGHLPAQHHVDH